MIGAKTFPKSPLRPERRPDTHRSRGYDVERLNHSVPLEGFEPPTRWVETSCSSSELQRQNHYQGNGSSPNGIRTRATTLKGLDPRPLDDGTKWRPHRIGLPQLHFNGPMGNSLKVYLYSAKAAPPSRHESW